MNKKILIIEDDEFLSDMYQTKFNAEGYEVTSAMDGEEGLRVLENDDNKPALILLDIVMPKMDGIEVLEKIKKMENVKNIPVIMLTNLGQKEEIDKAMEKGAANYLIKANYTPSEIVERVKDMMGGDK